MNFISVMDKKEKDKTYNNSERQSAIYKEFRSQ